MCVDQTPENPRSWWPRLSSPALRCLVGVVVFCAAIALYASRMATSFTFGDTADYLNSANNGALNERGNGVPLYITLLNLAIRLPLPFTVSDGLRCNFLTTIFGAASATLVYLSGLRLTKNPAPATIAATAFMVSGLVWSNSVWIMPHITMALVASIFVFLLIVYDDKPSPRSAAAMGSVLGLGFGLMPTNLLLVPLAGAFPLLRSRRAWAWKHVAWIAAGFAGGIVINALLIVVHEQWNPIVGTPDTPMVEVILYFFRGGNEAGWFLENLSVAAALRGLVALPAEIGADFEVVGVLLAITGLVHGLRSRPLIHLSLLGVVCTLAVWVGVYPGDTYMLHGLGAYPIAALWLAGGAHWWIGAIQRRWFMTARHGDAVAMAVLLLLMLGNIAVATVTYRKMLCENARPTLRSWLCRERVPARVGDSYLLRTKTALRDIPQGALIFGAAWDATDQLNHLVCVKGLRPDLKCAHDLSKFSLDRFRRLVEPSWAEGQPVFLYGEWKDVVTGRSELLAAIRGEPRAPFLFELFPMEHAVGTTTSTKPSNAP